ncbi:hypothetical protein [Streptomyces sp. NPDC058991]|uniref:hypothetical protein n=1 Tax=unclassified Streptomyces TaxID=2593676 RepID=UPI00368E056A
MGVPLARVAAQAGARSCCGRRTSRAVAPDGSVLIAGATTAPAQGDVDWAVHRILPKADGSLETRRLATVESVPAHIYGLCLGSGILTTADDSTLFQPFTNFGAYRGTWLNATGEPRAVRTTVDGLVSTDCSSGSTAERCVTMWASGDGFHGRGKRHGVRPHHAVRERPGELGPASPERVRKGFRDQRGRRDASRFLLGAARPGGSGLVLPRGAPVPNGPTRFIPFGRSDGGRPGNRCPDRRPPACAAPHALRRTPARRIPPTSAHMLGRTCFPLVTAAGEGYPIGYRAPYGYARG